LIKDGFDLVGFYASVYIVVDHHHRAETAGAETSDRFKGETAVSGGFSFLYVEHLFDAVTDLFASPDIACRPEADPYSMFATGLHGEK
jgi:hypothetical protein